MLSGDVPKRSPSTDLADRDRIRQLETENDNLRARLIVRHTLSVLKIDGAAIATTMSTRDQTFEQVPHDEMNPFRLDGKRVGVRWTKAGLRVGCHTITREALDLLVRLEE